MSADIDVYTGIRECDYRDEHYSVRDNGSVMRHPKGYRIRPLDNQWTFGIKDYNSGYMMISNHRVHIIVATAFYGPQDSKEMVVDHIDTNRCNNRPENLRWCTRLENALNNPVTRKKIEFLCGSIENFIKDPSCLRAASEEYHNVEWMRTVSADEARNAYNRVMEWAKHDSSSLPSGNHIDEWIFSSPVEKKSRYANPLYESFDYDSLSALPKENNQPSPKDGLRPDPLAELFNPKPQPFPTTNPLAVQYGWSVYSNVEFPCCPQSVSDNPIEEYFNLIQKGRVFITAKYGQSIVDHAVLKDNKIYVVTFIPESVKHWGIVVIKWENEHFVHVSQSTYFDKNGALHFITTKVLGEPWTGPDCVDFYCD